MLEIKFYETEKSLVIISKRKQKDVIYIKRDQKVQMKKGVIYKLEQIWLEQDVTKPLFEVIL